VIVTGVERGGRQAAMAEQHLDVAQVSAQRMRRID